MLLELLLSQILASSTPSIATTTQAVVTAYSAVESCDYANCVMANGLPAKVGYAACPRALPFGTQIRIDDAIFTCGDRTALRYDGRFDIFMGYTLADQQRALVWGIRTKQVEVLDRAYPQVLQCSYVEVIKELE